MDHKYCYRGQRENSTANPSFSSTLLDAIYRSIDETEAHHQEVEEEGQLVLYKETMRKKQSNISSSLKPNLGFQDEEEIANYQRACLIEKWMEKKVVVRRNFQRKEERTSEYDASSACTFFNSSSSSSDSSCGGGFSSSEAESVYGVSSSRTSCYGLNKPKPVRTSVSVLAQQEKSHHKREKEYNSKKYGENFQPKAKQEGSFLKTKSRALKIYGDLKKVKQPISPGGRLANFLNSIFTAGNTKKAKISSSSSSAAGVYDDGINSERKLKSANASTCSSASSFSRSCLSKTPSSRGKPSSNGMKRSVRFYPVSVIVDEDCQPCGQKSLYDDKPHMDLDKVKNIRSSLNEELKFHVMEKNRRVEEAPRDLLRNFHKKVDQCDVYDMIRNARIKDREFQNVDVDDGDDDQDEDDAASYASSDLFELDNLSAIGMERYREELPVYETTHLGTNRAIANGLIL